MAKLSRDLPFLGPESRTYLAPFQDEAPPNDVAKLYAQLYADFEETLRQRHPNSFAYRLGMGVLQQTKILIDQEALSYKNSKLYNRKTYLYAIESIYRSKVALEDPSNQVNLADMAVLAKKLPGYKSFTWRALSCLLVTIAGLALSIGMGILFPPAGAFAFIGLGLPHFMFQFGALVIQAVAFAAANTTAGLAAVGIATTVTPHAFAIGAAATGGAITLSNTLYSFKTQIFEGRSALESGGLSKAVMKFHQQGTKDPVASPPPDDAAAAEEEDDIEMKKTSGPPTKK